MRWVNVLKELYMVSDDSKLYMMTQSCTHNWGLKYCVQLVVHSVQLVVHWCTTIVVELDNTKLSALFTQPNVRFVCQTFSEERISVNHCVLQT